ncbi:hypothetical protein [Pantoea agglomerans]|uniref:Uncharacterized protein n=1 Tax=Enterobacter agglomerans TaxID=549 RepID=A0ACC5RK26_ENTAG|nr:hypothetical protein [Pantoea agglomerans]MBK4725014.1 hypothetical protein [Pantoea agglomerans]
MEQGEKLNPEEALPRNGVPDGRYVLWQSGVQWDVRCLVISGCKRRWINIADQLFLDMDTAWQAAFEHRTAIENNINERRAV